MQGILHYFGSLMLQNNEPTNWLFHVIYQTWKTVIDHISPTQRREIKIRLCSGVFLRNFKVFESVVKKCLEQKSMIIFLRSNTQTLSWLWFPLFKVNELLISLRRGKQCGAVLRYWPTAWTVTDRITLISIQNHWGSAKLFKDLPYKLDIKKDLTKLSA